MRNRNGFTLIEVMIAMTVLLIGILGTMSMQYYAISGNSSSRELRIATTLNTEYLAQIMGTPYDQMIILGGVTDSPFDDIAGEKFSFSAVSGGVAFTRSWWVRSSCRELKVPENSFCGAAGTMPACNITTASPSFSMLMVRTCWADRNGINHSVDLIAPRIDYP